MNNSVLKKAEKYVISLLSSNTPSEYVYHDVNHTKQVVEACEVIGKASGLVGRELEIVTLSGWFHDVGYIQKVVGHEVISINYAEQFLENFGYPIENIEKIKNCILATRMPQNPKNLLEEILCDADISHLGKKTFEDRNNLYRYEFEHHNGKPLTEREWLIKTIDFFNHHHFFTDYALKNFSEQKQKNLLNLQEHLQNIIEKTK